MAETAALLLGRPLLFADVCLRSLLFSVALVFVSPLRLARALSRFSLCVRDKADLDTIHRFSQVLENRVFRKGSCLRSALVVFSLQTDVSLKIGAAGRAASFEAHAWVERAGRVYSGNQRSDYEPLWSIER